MPACRDAPAPADPDLTVLRGATVIDPASGQVLPGAVVELRGSKIHAVLAHGTARYPEGTRALDLSGKFLLPGLIDTHAHTTVLLPDPATGEPRYDREASEQVLRLLLAFGVTAVRNPAAPTEAALALRDALAAGEIDGPRMWTSGEALNHSRASFSPFVSVRTRQEVREEVRRQVSAGVDWIKLYSTLTPDLVQTAIEEAHEAGVPVVGHLQRTTWTEAADLGIDGVTHASPWSRAYLPAGQRAAYDPTILGRLLWLEHVDPDGPEITSMTEALAANGVAVDPTLIAFHTKFYGNDPAVIDSPDLGRVPADVLDYWRRGSFTSDWSAQDFARAQALWPRLTALTRRMFDHGVLLTAGSDMPNPWVIPGVSLHQELRLLAEAGIPPLQVLRIATINGARSLRIDDETGSITAGKRADLLILNANPLENITATRSIETVIVGGEFSDPSALLK